MTTVSDPLCVSEVSLVDPPANAYTARSFKDEEDLRPVSDMINVCDRADDLDRGLSAEDLRTHINVPGRDVKRDVQIWEDPDARVVAFAMMWIPPEEGAAPGYLYFKVHPYVRGDRLGERVLQWAENRIREAGNERNLPPDLRTSARDNDTYPRELLVGAGFQPVRYFFDMLRPLDDEIEGPTLPDGYTLRHVESDDDVARWVDAFNQSFVDHWDFHPCTFEDRKHWLSDPAYLPEGDLVAVAPNGTFAAFCACTMKSEENNRQDRKEGLIDMLGTRRGHRNKGLGRAMLLSGLRFLKSKGLDTARLEVDGENPTGALRLYEAAGFKVHRTTIAYYKKLD